jgi:predicted nucleotidyltransferase
MHATPYPDINQILDHAFAAMRRTLGNTLVGLYLYGSLVTGDFDPVSSDIDLLAVTARDLDDQDAAALKRMHDEFAATYPDWPDRIEVQYVAASALRTCTSRPHALAVASPGEPFHVIQAGPDWLVNWYVVQQRGVTLFGPPPHTFIEPIAHDAFMQTIRQHMRQWPAWIEHLPRRRPSQAYAILTLCRGLYTLKHGEQVSKKQAALWAQRALPAWSALIADALTWRAHWRELMEGGEDVFPETVRFVHVVIEQIEREQLSAERLA